MININYPPRITQPIPTAPKNARRMRTLEYIAHNFVTINLGRIAWQRSDARHVKTINKLLASVVFMRNCDRRCAWGQSAFLSLAHRARDSKPEIARSPGGCGTKGGRSSCVMPRNYFRIIPIARRD